MFNRVYFGTHALDQPLPVVFDQHGYDTYTVQNLAGTYIIFPADRLQNFTIEVDNSPSDPKKGLQETSARCFHHTGPVGFGATIRLNCSQPIHGRYVTVLLFYDNALTLCEVEVLAIPAMGGEY